MKIAEGFRGIRKTVTGTVVRWSDDFLDDHTAVKNKIVYCTGYTPLYRAAFLADHSVKAVLMEEGGKNYHPLILLSDAGVAAVAGIGAVDFSDDCITVDSSTGSIYQGSISVKEREDVDIPRISSSVYANVGCLESIKRAAEAGADGIGILRTEFIAVRTLSKILTKEFCNTTVREALSQSNEADILYGLANHRRLKNCLNHDLYNAIAEALTYFGAKEVIVRTLDIPRSQNEPMGNRGIRRCIAEGGATIKLVAEALHDVFQEKGEHNIGVILPLVSHYSQIHTALDIILDSGVSLKQDTCEGISYGWEIEQPAASLNNEVWLTAFTKKYRCPPHFIGIGTNDLTQFTMALGRDIHAKENNPQARAYLEGLYDEGDFSIIKQIYDVSKQCTRFGTRLFLLGQAAANPEYAMLIRSLGITPSVAADSVAHVKGVIQESEKKDPEEAMRTYIETTCLKYPPEVRSCVKSALSQMLME